jgi:hypothetical protein
LEGRWSRCNKREIESPKRSSRGYPRKMMKGRLRWMEKRMEMERVRKKEKMEIMRMQQRELLMQKHIQVMGSLHWSRKDITRWEYLIFH